MTTSRGWRWVVSIPTGNGKPDKGATGPAGACTATPPPGIANAGGAPINGWTVRWTLASGQTISQLWNGTLSTSGSGVTVRNISYNGSLAAKASTTFGFLASGSPSTPSLSVTTP